MQIQYETLCVSDFEALVGKLFSSIDLSDDDRIVFRETVFAIQSELKTRLSFTWHERQDFEIAFDYQFCRCLAGAIYSDRIYCAQYVSIVSDVLLSFANRWSWAFHTCHEDVNNPGLDRGEFVITQGKCVMSESMEFQWRKRLAAS